MAIRVITLLLAVMMMTTAAAPDLASPDPIASIDDAAPDLDTPTVPPATIVAVPDRTEVRFASTPVSLEIGRMHAVTVFRPPRA